VGGNRRLVGQRGEDRAAAWYAERGYQVVGRNWRCRAGEIDLILLKGREYVFCEVKTRSSTAFGVPAEAVTHSKQARIRRSAARWLAEQPARRPAPVRFDVVAILGGDLEVLEGAF
jgi:putative endonuclease